MILSVYVGNKNIILGGFEGDKMPLWSVLSTDTSLTIDEYIVKFKQIITHHISDLSKVEGVMVASVVPQLNHTIHKALDFVFLLDTRFVGAGIKTGINLQCDDPASVGADIVCDCVAARNLYGNPCVIVDVDTVIKVIAVNKNGAFVGASVHPGLEMGLDALVKGSAQLSYVDLSLPDKLIGKNTVDCIKSGMLHGTASMIDGMIVKYKKELGEDAKVILTGKDLMGVYKLLEQEVIVDNHLTLKGIKMVYEKNFNNEKNFGLSVNKA